MIPLWNVNIRNIAILDVAGVFAKDFKTLLMSNYPQEL